VEEKIKIINLLQAKQLLEYQLQALVYSCVKIREKNSNKYIYVHYREDGVALTKYVGEYSEELYNLVLNNSIKAKDLKKQIRDINKKLKHTWEFILNKNVILSNTNFALLCQINKMVEEGFYYTAGKIRNVPVSVGGITWKPDLPIESVVKEEIDKILNKEIEDVEKAIELLLYTMKKQIFIDGNKRTSVIYANHYLISKGKGIIVIPAELTEEFKNLLIPYYVGKDEAEIKTFIN